MMRRTAAAAVSCLLLWTPRFCQAFSSSVPHRATTTRTTSPRIRNSDSRIPSPSSSRSSSSTSCTQLFSSNNSGNSMFDVSKPVFDLYALRSVRGDALVKYNTLNQSEPLRINLWALLTLVALLAPSLQQAVTMDVTNTVSSSMTTAPTTTAPTTSLPTVLGSAAATITFAVQFVRECQKRNQQLMRMEKELQALELPLRLLELPSNTDDNSAKNKALLLSTTSLSSLYANQLPTALTIQQAQAQTTLRVVAVATTDPVQARQCLLQWQALAKRCTQANTVVVPLFLWQSIEPWSLSSTTQQIFSGMGLSETTLRQYPWLALPADYDQWKSYFETTLAKENGSDDATTTTNLKWFGLSATGRSFGSGQGELPSALQLLGQHLRPTTVFLGDGAASPEQLLAESTTEKDDDERAVLQQLQAFYTALTSGDLETMESQIFASSNDESINSVSSVMEQGGRLDPWSLCLQDGNRPAGMKIGDPQVTVVPADGTNDGNDPTQQQHDMAYTTVIECPDVNTIEAAVDTPTLLALQTWVRDDGNWRLLQHQTIPWSDLAPAQGTLICDGRGCVSLVRGGRN